MYGAYSGREGWGSYSLTYGISAIPNKESVTPGKSARGRITQILASSFRCVLRDWCKNIVRASKILWGLKYRRN